MKHQRKIIIAILIIAGFLVYVNALSNKFVWDDEEQVVNNQVIQDASNIPMILTSGTFYAGGAGLSGSFYRPLVSLFYLVNYQIWGLQPWGFHIFQIFLHLINVVLVYFLLEKILFSFKINFAKSAAFLTALIFAIHPANVESVAYIGGIADVLYGFFVLAAFYIFVSGINLEKETINGARFFWFFAIAFLGLLAKESAAVIFPIAALYLYLLFKPGWKFWLKRFIPQSLFVIGFCLILRIFLAGISFNQPQFSPIAKSNFLTRLLTLPAEIFVYIKTIFFPRILATSQHFVVNSASDIRFWGLGFILLLIGVFILFLATRQKEILKPHLFFISWFFIGIFPALNIVLPLDMTAAERWLYFPMIGALSFAVISLMEAVKKTSSNWRNVAYIFLGAVIVLLSFRTIIRNGDWKDGLTLYGRDIEYSQESFNLENNYGVELFRAGRIDEAEKHFKNSITLQNNWSPPHNNLGAVYEKRGDLEKAKEAYQKSIDFSDYYLAYENMAGLLIKMEETGQAKTFLENALKKFPQNPRLNLMLSAIYYNEKK
ncbi:MAG: hypothetical protein Q7S78_01650 [Candidatus Azambacteria bacterium]|nr:hypothetical protein [Candidatus Azambacteria bacterium]